MVFFDRELAREFDYRCKQGGQLASKMRFISAPWVGMLQGRRLAAPRCARQSDGGVTRIEASPDRRR